MTIGEFGMLLALIGPLPYIWLIVRGKVRPHRTSWFVWSAIMLLGLWGYDASGAEDSIWFLVGDFIATFATFLLSLWRGVGGWSRFDLTCLAIALTGLAVWQFSGTPLFALFGVVLADAVALTPTIIKSFRDPESEASSAYVFSSLAALCGIVAVGTWDFVLLLYPAYLFFANALTAAVITVGHHLQRSTKTKRGAL